MSYTPHERKGSQWKTKTRARTSSTTSDDRRKDKYGRVSGGLCHRDSDQGESPSAWTESLGRVERVVLSTVLRGEHESEHHLVDREAHDGLGEHDIERVEREGSQLDRAHRKRRARIARDACDGPSRVLVEKSSEVRHTVEKVSPP